MLNALSETTLTPIAGMAFEGAKDWISQIISQAGTTVSNSASSIEALLPSDVRKTVREEVAHGVARPAAPLTAYLLGLRDGLDQQNQTALLISQIQGLIDNSG